MSPAKAITLEKVFLKLEKLEHNMAELRHSVIPSVKLSKSELKEISKVSNEMKKGKYLTAKQAISLLEK